MKKKLALTLKVKDVHIPVTRQGHLLQDVHVSVMKWHGRSHQPHSKHGLCLPAAGWVEDGVVDSGDSQTGAKRMTAREPKETRRDTMRVVCFHACEFENRRKRNYAVWNTNKGGRR